MLAITVSVKVAAQQFDTSANPLGEGRGEEATQSPELPGRLKSLRTLYYCSHQPIARNYTPRPPWDSRSTQEFMSWSWLGSDLLEVTVSGFAAKVATSQDTWRPPPRIRAVTALGFTGRAVYLLQA